MPYTREQIRKGPRVKPNDPIDVATERRLLEHYGIAVDAGRAADLGGREDDAISARPG